MSSFPMIAPDGSVGEVPADKVHDAIAAGGKLGYAITAPDGSEGIIPAERIHDAISAGGILKGAQPSSKVPISAALQNPQNITEQGRQVGQAIKEGTLGDLSAPQDVARSAEMAIPAAAAEKAVVSGALKLGKYAQLPSKVEQSRKAAGAAIGAVEQAIPNAAVDTTKALETALEARKLKDAGATLPQVINKFLDRMGLGESLGAGGGAIPNAPYTFSEGRAAAQVAGDLSASEKLAAGSKVKHYVDEFAKEIGASLKETAKAHGFEPQYSKALADYKAAKNIQEVQAAIKKWGIGTILGALGSGTLAYAARQGWRLGDVVPNK